MKHHLFLCIALTVLQLLSFSDLYAQHHWAMAVVGKGKAQPTILEYHSETETAGNGVTYHRIVDDSYRFRQDTTGPVRLQYGYRWVGKQQFVYDFENEKETLALDFNLTVGDLFTTVNGQEWIVEAVRDTAVNVSFCGKGENVTRCLLCVRSVDGKRSDLWLENFGSLTNHFMLNSLENVEYAQSLWMEYEEGEYLAREITAGPIFAHDSGWMDGTYGDGEGEGYSRCTWQNGKVVFENVKLWYEHRDYTCFYRVGDDIYKLYSWEMHPHIDNGTLALRRDVITFEGLPTPAHGMYTLHLDGREFTTGIDTPSTVSPSDAATYDLQGRRVTDTTKPGVYVRNGRKVVKR